MRGEGPPRSRSLVPLFSVLLGPLLAPPTVMVKMPSSETTLAASAGSANFSSSWLDLEFPFSDLRVFAPTSSLRHVVPAVSSTCSSLLKRPFTSSSSSSVSMTPPNAYALPFCAIATAIPLRGAGFFPLAFTLVHL
uniref:Putative secreted protein n=1 Tax=Anopheles triannulatus TaxID=58253 RepID=A0A2M4B5I1_9DIPT